MKTQKCFIMRFLATMLLTNIAFASGGVIRIPLDTFTKPPSDLVENGKPLNFSDLAKIYENDHEALSKVNPIENKYWQNKKYSAVDLELHAKMPKADAGVTLDSYMGANRELGFYSVVIRTDSNEKYILTLGQQVNASLLKSALLRKLGYFQESPKYYPKIKMKFATKEQKDTFINTAFCENGPSETASDCLSISPFLTESNHKEYLSHDGELGLYVHGCYLEKMNEEVPSLFDGLTPASGGSLPYFSTSRAFRALVLPFVAGDMGESLNRVSTQPVEVRDGWANINYGSDQYFEESSANDVQWVARRAAALTKADWDEIVDASKYPPATRQLVQFLVMSRTKNFVDSFFKKKSRSEVMNSDSGLNFIPSGKYDSADGCVKKGKVVCENIPDYPQRFSNGDRQSPFESGDFMRFMKVKLVSSTIGIATGQLQNYLQINTKVDQQNKGYEVGPKGFRPLGTVTGTNVGLGFSATRTITTGTFYGSQAPIQLVDSISVSAGLGLMHVINEVGGYGINIGANVNYTRDFTHVRPLNSIKDSNNVPWTEVNVKFKLDRLAKLMADGKFTEKDGDKPATDGFASFMADLRPGEVFLISDYIGAGAQVGASVGLESLIGFNAGMFSPSVGLTAGGSKVLMRQTQITKTDDGLQIFVRNGNTKAFSLALDVNYFINLMKIKAETVKSDLHTDAFILNYSGDLVSQGDGGKIDLEGNPDIAKKYEQQKAFGRHAAGAIRGLIRQSSTDQLYAYFPFQKFSIDHMIKTNTIKTKLLWYRATRLDEEHVLTIQKPIINTPEGSTVVNEPIQIVSHRKGELKGRDLLGFGLDAVDGTTAIVLKGYSPKLSQASQNPTQMPFGQAQWRIVKTEAEITKNRKGALPTVAMIQHVWGGWSIKRKKLDQIVESIKEHIKGTEYEGSELIPNETLRNVDKIDFYRVTSTLSLMPSGIEKMKQLAVNPGTTGLTLDEPTAFGQLIRNIVHIKDKRRLEDKAVYNGIITMMGDGDFNKGHEIYLATCRANADDGVVYNTRLKGTEYECLEPWFEKIIKLSRSYGKGSVREQTEIMTSMLFTLEDKIPFSSLLKYLGKENYVFYIEISGFRTGDENADIGTYMSNILGEPEKKRPYSNGLMSVISEKSKIISTEIDRTQADFQ